MMSHLSVLEQSVLLWNIRLRVQPTMKACWTKLSVKLFGGGAQCILSILNSSGGCYWYIHRAGLKRILWELARKDPDSTFFCSFFFFTSKMELPAHTQERDSFLEGTWKILYVEVPHLGYNVNQVHILNYEKKKKIHILCFKHCTSSKNKQRVGHLAWL